MTPAPPPEDTSALTSGRGRRGTLTARFLQAVGREVGADGLTPAALTRAVVQVLPVDGAGMSILTGALRTPLGWSSVTVRRAEELQTTLGEGPCLTAAQTQTSVVFDADDLATRWSLYSKELIGKTPFRAVAAIPLRVPGQGVFAALDLFTHDPKLTRSARPRRHRPARRRTSRRPAHHLHRRNRRPRTPPSKTRVVPDRRRTQTRRVGRHRHGHGPPPRTSPATPSA